MAKRIEWVRRKLPVVVRNRDALRRMIADEAETLFIRQRALDRAKAAADAGVGSWLVGPADYAHLLGKAEADFTRAFYEAVPNDRRHKELAEAMFPGEGMQRLQESSARLVVATLGLYGLFAGGVRQFFGGVMAQQRAARLRVQLDPHAASFLKNARSYTVGRGVKFTAAAAEIETAYQQGFWVPNRMSKLNKDRFEDWLTNGEAFTLYRGAGQGQSFRLWAVPVLPEEVTEIVRRDNYLALAYKREFEPEEDGSARGRSTGGRRTEQWLLDAQYEEVLERGVTDLPQEIAERVEEGLRMLHFKFGSQERGQVPLLPVLRYFQYYDQFVKDTVRLHHEQSRVIMIEYRTGRVSASAQEDAPEGGIKLVGARGQLEWEFMSPDINPGMSEKVGRMIRLSVAGGTRTPEFILFQDGSNQNYASIRKSENPYTQFILDLQDAYGYELSREAAFFVRQAVAARALPLKLKILRFDEEALAKVQGMYVEMMMEDVDVDRIVEQVTRELGTPVEEEVPTEDVPIGFEFPAIVQEDPRALAETLKIHDELGIVDPETAATKAGYDWKTVLARNIRHRKLMAELRRQEREQEMQSFGRPEGGPFPPEEKEAEE